VFAKDQKHSLQEDTQGAGQSLALQQKKVSSPLKEDATGTISISVTLDNCTPHSTGSKIWPLPMLFLNSSRNNIFWKKYSQRLLQL